MYLSLIRQNLEDAEVRVLAYCLMTNHVHLVVVPKRPDSLAVLFRRVHGRYAQFFNIRHHRSGHVWQSRFYSCPLSTSHLWHALRYVEQNPCRAGLADAPGEYRWSSAAVHLGECADRERVLDLDYWTSAGGAETWRDMHRAYESEETVYQLRRCGFA